MRANVLSTLAGLALCSVLAIAPPFAASVANEIPADEKRLASAYFIGDLPLWTADGTTFDPKLLIAYLKSNIDDNLHPGDEAPTVKYFADTKSLIVTGIESNHERIKSLLNDLRGD